PCSGQDRSRCLGMLLSWWPSVWASARGLCLSPLRCPEPKASGSQPSISACCLLPLGLNRNGDPRPLGKRPRRAMAQLGVALWAFLGIGFFGTGVPQVDAELRITAQIVYIAPILVLALWRLRQKPDPFDLCLAIGIVASLVVAIASRDRTGSLETVGLSTAFILLFWAMRTVASVSHIRKALIVGVACALTGWLMAFSAVWIIEDLNWMRAGGGIPDLEPTAALIWVSPNVIPILTLLGIAFLVDLPKGRLRVLLLALFGAASVVAVPLSNGRSAWLGLL